MPDALLQELLPLKPRELKKYLRGGYPIDPDAIDGQAYLGVSLGLPAWADRLAWKTFQKAFKRDPASGELRGWNVRLQQDGFDAPPVARQRKGKPLTFGHFRVVSTADRAMPAGTDAGLLIDYGLEGKSIFEFDRMLRDPIVAMRRDDPSVLLGWSYLQLPRRTLPTPSFFLLIRPQPITHVPPAFS